MPWWCSQFFLPLILLLLYDTISFLMSSLNDLRPVKRVKGVGLLSFHSQNNRWLIHGSVPWFIHPMEFVLKPFLWHNRVHFPLTPLNAVFFHHGTSQNDFLWAALSELHNKGFWIMEMCCLGTETAAMLLSRMHLYQNDKLKPKCSAWQQLGQNI